jgi:hypothetical protein
VNQLRIKLDTAFARRLFNYDTTNAYKTDSIFRSLFKGFAVRSEGSGNAVMGFSLAGINTKLAIYYNYPKPAGAGRNTTVNYFFYDALGSSKLCRQRLFRYTGSQCSRTEHTSTCCIYSKLAGYLCYHKNSGIDGYE